MKKTIAIVGTNGLPGRYGGWDQLLHHLTEQLEGDYSFVVYTSSSDAQPGIKEVNGAKLIIVPLKANGIQSIPYDIVSMIYSVWKRHDVLLILGTSGCIFMPLLNLFGVRTVLNPDGAEYERGKWGRLAKWFLMKSESLGVRYASKVISDNVVIKNTIQTTYNVPSTLIEYGGDHVQYVVLSETTKKTYSIDDHQYAFKVCRIVPENNIDLILHCFSKTSIPLVLIGNWNFSSYGRNLREQYSRFKNLILLDPIYHQKTLDELRGNCGIYIHGHSVGGTNPSLVEAMHLSLCCFVYDVSYNRETTDNAALYFSTEDELSALLSMYEENKIDTDQYKKAMSQVAQKRYNWSNITSRYSEVFKELLSQK